MLTHISIRNYAIIEQWDIELRDGLTVVTGESGAGKSILIDAIELGLGARADSSSIRQGAKRAEINLSFDISQLPTVQLWLKENFFDGENEDECLIRRVIADEGRSSVSLNGTPCTLQQIKSIAALLMSIHGQHQNQTLLNKSHQLEMVDTFANHSKLLEPVKAIFTQWQDTQAQLHKLQNHSDNFQAQVDLLEYQVSELDEMNLAQDEYEQLDMEQKNLANAEQYLSTCYTSLQQLNGDDGQGINDQLYSILNKLNAINCEDSHISNAIELINNAIIQCDETHSELQSFIDHFAADPERLNEVESRLELIHTLARKHHVEPANLYEKHMTLREELDGFLNSSSHIQALEQQLSSLKAEFIQHAERLSKSRQKAAKKLCAEVSEKIHQLGMKGGQFAIQWNTVKDDNPHAFGLETAEFMVSANPGQPMQPLSKVASGGEISRIALAIQVITSQNMITPTLVFDEVDVGIGGTTAAIVGQILRELSRATQVLCITHQPQVASCGNQHVHVHKTSEKNSTRTAISELSHDQRIDEIARMLGGLKITERTINNAKELLAEV